jgi:DNA-binding response OmpR family regulator
MNKTVVVIEDERDIVESIRYFLKKNGFDVDSFETAESFFSLNSRPDNCIYLVDWNLPGIKGTDLIRTIRIKDKLSPIFMISAYNKPDQIVEGLQSGADDYITKPFNFDELLVRITNAYNKVSSLQDNLLNVGLKLIPEAHAIIKEGQTVNLTSREFVIFKYLYDNMDKASSSREEIITQFDKDLEMTARNIDVHIFSLRKKISKINVSVETVWGAGYKLSVR